MATAHFSNIQNVLLSEIDKAERTIDVAVAWFSSRSLFELICMKLKQGVTVRLAIRNDYKNNHDRALDWQQFINEGGVLYFDNSDSLHHKYCIIDGTTLITGSYNWTNNAAYRSIENILITDQSDTIVEYIEDFSHLIKKLSPIRVNNRLQGLDLSEAVRCLYDEEIELELVDYQDGSSEEDILKMALYLYRKKKYQEAEKLLSSLLNSKFTAHANSILSAISLKQGFYNDSIRLGKKGIINTPAVDADTHNTIASAYSEIKKYAEAKFYLTQSISLDPSTTTWYANKIGVLCELGLHNEADKVALKFKELAANIVRQNKGLFNRTVLKARIELGGLSRQNGSMNDAHKHGEKAKEIYFQLADSDQDLHDFDDINELFK